MDAKEIHSREKIMKKIRKNGLPVHLYFLLLCGENMTSMHLDPTTEIFCVFLRNVSRLKRDSESRSTHRWRFARRSPGKIHGCKVFPNQKNRSEPGKSFSKFSPISCDFCGSFFSFPDNL